MPHSRSNRVNFDDSKAKSRTVSPAQRRKSLELLPSYSRIWSNRTGRDGKTPLRSTKVSEKLVLIPDTSDGSDAVDDGAGPPRDDEQSTRSKTQAEALGATTYAEALPKFRRTEKVARVTAYCTANTYRLQTTAEFLKVCHQARAKLYDNCLYAAYQFPLRPGTDGYRVRSSPSADWGGKGKSFLEEEIEHYERLEHRDDEPIGLDDTDSDGEDHGRQTDEGRGHGSREPDPTAAETARKKAALSQISGGVSHVGELFLHSYGVAVFWNFTERQERDILADMTFAASETNVSLVSQPLPGDEFETEEFHFQYDLSSPRPRIFNDMITLRSSDHMVKLAMSHAVAQSTKLSFFEDRMAKTMAEAQYVPQQLATTGRLGMKREDVMKIMGRLYTSRVDVNLSSNMLDMPNFFWDDEPTLRPLYNAVRQYMEIQPRIKALNERCRVFLELAEILNESIADTKMTNITWIIIILIIVSIIVTCLEAFIRFYMRVGAVQRASILADKLETFVSPEGI